MMKKVAIVTGAARGIGAAISTHLVAVGYQVLGVDLDWGQLANQLSTGTKIDGILQVPADISTQVGCEKVLTALKSKFSGLDILVNNAAISPKAPDNSRKNIFDIESDEWDRVMAINVRSVFLLSKLAFPFLLKRHGNIINIGSMMGVVGAGNEDENVFPSSISGAHYCASKAAVINLTYSLAREFSSKKIRVNCVSPGAVLGGMGNFSGPTLSRLQGQIPLHELALPEHIANAVLFLSEQSHITGHNLHINGGWLMR